MGNSYNSKGPSPLKLEQEEAMRYWPQLDADNAVFGNTNISSLRATENAGYHRHYRDRNNKDIVFQQECDKIHSYFLHSAIKFNETDIKKEETQWKSIYVGKKEDETWYNIIACNDDIDSESGDELKKIEEIKYKDEEEMYRLLVENMGVFKWQNPHGFRTEQIKGLMHLKPKFKNIKEEALNTSYSKLSADAWNATLRKSKIFHQSWARQRIRTLYPDTFIDAQKEVKLYTDFDELQYELKKCFRWESIMHQLDKDNIPQPRLWKYLRKPTYSGFASYIDNNGSTYDYLMENPPNDPEGKGLMGKRVLSDDYDDTEGLRVRRELEGRLKEFFNWSLELLVVLNKFGTIIDEGGKDATINLFNRLWKYLKEGEPTTTFGMKINERNMELYHGVNAKMILNPAETMAFGPSYHVAKTFATAKGMVLKITSQYPRSDFGRAFDASLISDYPEEQEYFNETESNAQHPKAKSRPDDWKKDVKNDARNKQIMTILFTKFNLFPNTPNLKQVIKMDQISAGLKEFFLEKSSGKDVQGNDKYIVDGFKQRDSLKLQSQKHDKDEVSGIKKGRTDHTHMFTYKRLPATNQNGKISKTKKFAISSLPTIKENCLFVSDKVQSKTMLNAQAPEFIPNVDESDGEKDKLEKKGKLNVDAAEFIPNTVCYQVPTSSKHIDESIVISNEKRVEIFTRQVVTLYQDYYF